MSRIFFNGVDLKATYNFVVQSINNPFNIEIPSVAIQGRDGEIYFEDLSRLDKRTITLTGKIYGNSHADVMSKILGLKNLISTANNRGKLEVEYNDGSGTKTKYMYVQLAGEIWNTQPIGARAGFAAANLTIRFSAIDKPFWIVETSNNNIVVAPLTNLKYGGTWWKDLGWKLEPYTIVNLLGKYGDFETGSGGIADGWIASGGTGTLDTNSLFNTYSQKIIGDGTNSSVGLKRNISVITNHYYYAIVYSKISDITNVIEHGIYYEIVDGDISWISRELTPTTSWALKVALFQGTVDGDITFSLYAQFDTATNANGIDVYFDGCAVYDLTAMGTLPYGLQQYFSPSGITQWEDLATTNSIEALDGKIQLGKDWLVQLLPFVNSVATLGWEVV